MPEIDESAEHAFKRYEALYAAAREDLRAAQKDYDRVEEKAGKLVSLVAIIIAIGGLSFAEIAKSPAQKGGASYFFLIFIGIIVAISLVTFLYTTLRIYLPRNIFSVDMDEEQYKHYKSNRYIDVLDSVARQHLEPIMSLKSATQDKFGWLKWAGGASYATTVSLAICIFLYIYVVSNS